MSRVQLALNVDNLAEGVAFYSKLFNAEPAKLQDGYANFAITEPPLKLVLIENPGHGGTINHLGVEVKTSDKVHDEIGRLAAKGLFTEEDIGTTCCFATQDNVWVTGPGGDEVGGVHRARRLRDVRHQPAAPRRRCRGWRVLRWVGGAKRAAQHHDVVLLTR